jgi:hypothetical protein
VSLNANASAATPVPGGVAGIGPETLARHLGCVGIVAAPWLKVFSADELKTSPEFQRTRRRAFVGGCECSCPRDGFLTAVRVEFVPREEIVIVTQEIAGISEHHRLESSLMVESCKKGKERAPLKRGEFSGLGGRPNSRVILHPRMAGEGSM